MQYNASADCGSCAAGYGLYPFCRAECDNANDCNSHATNVSGVTPNCSCTCRNQWSGPSCASCAVQFDSSNDCGSCALTFSGDFPACYMMCTVFANCSGNAVNVSGNTNSGCNCTCRNSWTGPNCSNCPATVDPSEDCGKCAAGYTGYPNCSRLCTPAQDCNGNAYQANGIFGNCTCLCSSAWVGPTCDVCPANFNKTAANCSTCATGYTKYPICVLLCTNANNCSGHALTVFGDTLTGCSCNCRNQWRGPDCSVCDSNLNATLDCGVCADGYDSYPDCYLTCTAAMNCSNHAASVSGNTFTGCTCHCRNSWSDSNCSTCALNFNITDDCGSCSPGYVDYPSGCPRLCTVATDCTGHASNVTGVFPNCVCFCSEQWNGTSCESCPPQYDPNYNCFACNVGFSGDFPDCFANCDVVRDCNDHATDATGNTKTGCNCTCRNEWFGPNCSMCPPNYDPTADCGSCSAGYDPPNCLRRCNPIDDCNSHANTSTGYEPNCTCDCRNKWYGQKCQSCAANYSVTHDCGTCTGGYINYPDCFFACTTTANCSGRATSVAGNDAVGCLCSCRNNWLPPYCSTCAANNNVSLDCGACIAGYGGYPNCRRICTIQIDCYGNADSVSGLEGDCVCQCRNAWTNNCSTCPGGFNSSSDCASCAPGYVSYPDCWRLCTVQQDCSGHASSVFGNVNTSCHCSCSNHWTGSNCSQCPSNYNGSTGCYACANGFEDPPNCYQSCTADANCSGNAMSVSGNTATGCTCYCSGNWSTKDCGYCPSIYNASAGCVSCADGRDTYPYCWMSCTMSNCSAIGTAYVTGNAYTGCSCHCKNHYGGSQCDWCPLNYDPMSNCTNCSAGYVEEPYCWQACTPVNCSNNAANVSGNWASGCACGCRNNWLAPNCSVCPPNFDAANDCGPCAAGYGGSGCFRQCTSAIDCSGHGIAYGTVATGCSCACSGQWQGASCNVCPPQFDANQSCTACAAGYVNYPDCYLGCAATTCNGRGVASGNVVTGCSCRCRNKWTGAACEACPHSFSAATDCGSCGPGAFGTYPNCTGGRNTKSISESISNPSQSPSESLSRFSASTTQPIPLQMAAAPSMIAGLQSATFYTLLFIILGLLIACCIAAAVWYRRKRHLIVHKRRRSTLKFNGRRTRGQSMVYDENLEDELTKVRAGDDYDSNAGDDDADANQPRSKFDDLDDILAAPTVHRPAPPRQSVAASANPQIRLPSAPPVPIRQVTFDDI